MPGATQRGHRVQFRFHVYQQSPTGRNIEPRLSGPALEHQYAELVSTLRRYCEARGAISVSGAADPELTGVVVTISGGLHREQAGTLMGDFLKGLNERTFGLVLVGGLIE